jgi:hypothetical protein
MGDFRTRSSPVDERQEDSLCLSAVLLVRYERLPQYVRSILLEDRLARGRYGRERGQRFA